MSVEVYNLVSAIKAAEKRKQKFLFLNLNKKVLFVIKTLKKEGFINYFSLENNKVKVYLKNFLQEGHFLKFFMKSFSNKAIWKSAPRSGSLILNTAKGCLSDRCAKIENLGGVFLFYIK